MLGLAFAILNVSFYTRKRRENSVSLAEIIQTDGYGE